MANNSHTHIHNNVIEQTAFRSIVTSNSFSIQSYKRSSYAMINFSFFFVFTHSHQFNCVRFTLESCAERDREKKEERTNKR